MIVVHNTALSNLIIFPLILQAIITAQIMSIGGVGHNYIARRYDKA